jgi:hypothetical protein
VVDVFIYLIGGVDENEVMLANALSAIVESLTILLKYCDSNQKSVRETCFD